MASGGRTISVTISAAHVASPGPQHPGWLACRAASCPACLRARFCSAQPDRLLDWRPSIHHASLHPSRLT
eukprot:353069-Chlamydomonas_euryale.AAC.9